MKTFTLLVWESIPESCDLYLVPDDTLTEEEHKTLDDAQDQYANDGDITDEGEVATEILSNALCDNPEHLSKDHPAGSKWAQRFISFKVEAGSLPAGTVVSKIIRTGYFM